MDSSRAACFRQTLSVLLCALGLRLLVLWAVLAHYPRSWFFSRGLEMGLLANSLVSGKGLSSPFGVPTGPTAFIAPGYPLLVASVFRVFGSYTTASLVVLVSAQILANVATVWLVMQVARALAGQRAAQAAAWIAGMFWACSLPLLWMPTIFWDTSFSACIVLGTIAAALRLRGRFSRNVALGCGAACGLIALLNPALLPAIFAILLWLAWQNPLPLRVRAARLLLAACVFAVVFSPWPIRNARVFHAFIPLRTTVGFELWMGNRDGATGFLDESIFPMYNQRELSAYKAQGEVAYTQGKSQLAKAYIQSHPAGFLRLTARRIVRFWTGTGNLEGSPIFALHACLSSLFGLTGLGLLFRRKARALALLFVLPLLLFPLPYYITHAEFRYRLVIDPLLTVLAGYAIATLWERFHRPHASTHQPKAAEVVLAC
jgi:4-amino-4-deoxy-L-arabinose transferase-like glycosyltransferase